jgi:hypothetical protein
MYDAKFEMPVSTLVSTSGGSTGASGIAGISIPPSSWSSILVGTNFGVGGLTSTKAYGGGTNWVVSYVAQESAEGDVNREWAVRNPSVIVKVAPRLERCEYHSREADGLHCFEQYVTPSTRSPQVMQTVLSGFLGNSLIMLLVRPAEIALRYEVCLPCRYSAFDLDRRTMASGFRLRMNVSNGGIPFTFDCQRCCASMELILFAIF